MNGLAGPRCTLEASAEWTILEVHEAIEAKLGVPFHWQRLVKDTEKLAWKVEVASLISETPDETLQLTLIVEEAPEPEPMALREAIEGRNETLALLFLKRKEASGLSELDPDGLSLLHSAIAACLQRAALVIAGKPSFTQINAKDRWGSTALHYAAGRGSLPVCQAILGHADFKELLAVNSAGRTALEVACNQGHRGVAARLSLQAQLQ